MKTLVEKFMEKEGKPMPKNFKKMDMERWMAWRRGEVKDNEFEEWANEQG